ncbi:S1 family peptidase [Microbacterium sp. VKM Ac-2923]|uniref:S1 family peptidase n=1 Tax=Microbacterium sp. VKM Ac-2923 TaxID=2929476 RepID=UPI001FB47D0C|nr:S1 family peptidase [Microbacterium sp. VKM Ac-2923]MCJ1708244.1 S1 family peptidase [Microbacterium sp. VKM Ac-2923]
MNRFSKTVVGAAALGLFLTTAATAPALAQTPTSSPDAAVDGVDAQLLEAMAADLGTDVSGAQDVLRFQADAAGTTDDIAAATGDAFAGTWLDESTRTVYAAATTDAALDSAVDAGAVPVAAEYSLTELEAITAQIAASPVPDAIPSWWIDVEANDVVVDVVAGGEQSATDFVASLGAPADAVRLQTGVEAPETFATIRGGMSYLINNAGRCSVGFAVQGGFVTAGHCGVTGDSTNYGTFRGSSFPGNDYAWVATPNHTPVGQVMDYSGGAVAVKGSTQAAVGATVCRSGSTTGWYCGQIQGFNSTVRYAEGSVSGLIRTSVCAEPGDSGGSLLAGNQAQGVTSGGSGDCTVGGTTYFQPVNEILQTYNLRLLTS